MVSDKVGLDLTKVFELDENFCECMSENGGTKPPSEKVYKETGSNFDELSETEHLSRIIGFNQRHYIDQCSLLQHHVHKLCRGQILTEIRMPYNLFRYTCQLLKWFSERIERTDTSCSLHDSIDTTLDLMKLSIQDQEGTKNICEKSLLYDIHGVAEKKNCLFIGYISLSTYRRVILSIAMIFGYLSPGLFFGMEKVKLIQCLSYMIFFYLKTYLNGGCVSTDLERVYDKLKKNVNEIVGNEDGPLIGASCDLLVSLIVNPSNLYNEYLDEDLVLPVHRFERKNIAWFSDDFGTDASDNADGIYYSVSEHIVRSFEIFLFASFFSYSSSLTIITI